MNLRLRKDQIPKHLLKFFRSVGHKPKDLINMPAMLAEALREDGWTLRQEIIWAKPAPMPESVTDRCTKAHESIFLLAKSGTYFCDMEAIKEAASSAGEIPGGSKYARADSPFIRATETTLNQTPVAAFRNRRSVWNIASAPYAEAHFATYPPELIRPMIRAGTSEKGCCPVCLAPWVRIKEKFNTGKTQKMADGWDTGEGSHGTIHRSGREKGEKNKPVMGTRTKGWQPSCKCGIAETQPCRVLDPFGGSGTTGMVSRQEGRECIMIELNEEYANLHRARVEEKPPVMSDADAPLFAESQ